MKLRSVATLIVLVSLSTPLWAGTKEAQHQQMLDLAQEMRQLRSQGQGGSATHAALDAQYRAISAAMGGDDPASTLPNGHPAVDGRRLDGLVGSMGFIPAVPPGCVDSTVTATQSTPVAIPTGPGVVTSTLNVAGAGPYLWDLNLRTFITHTFAADLDITLQSPSGTIVTLTTDNGAGNDDVFNGTIWDDQANPGGQVPYTTNNGLVTDHLYVNLTLASPLVPEEALSAFLGEDPNGTWTLTISDDLAGDGGNLAEWTLEVTTLPAPPITTNTVGSNNTPVAIPTGPGVVDSQIVVAGAGQSIVGLTVTTNITHTFAADLDITLQSPAGTVVTFTTDNGAGNDDVFNGTIWDDQANPGGQVPYTTNNGLVTDHLYVNLTLASPLVPEEALGAFLGEDPNGTWTLTISDDLAGDGGNLAGWSISVDTGTCACTLVCPANMTTGNDLSACGAIVAYPAPTGCAAATCDVPSGSFFAVGTTTVTCNAPSATSPCSFDVTVDDLEPPAISCGGDVILDLPPGQNTGVVNFADPIVSDNCPGVAAPSCAPPSGSIFGLGMTTVTCSTADGASNSASCDFDVIIGGGASILEIPTTSGRGLALLGLILSAVGLAVIARNR